MRGGDWRVMGGQGFIVKGGDPCEVSVGARVEWG